MKKLEYMLMALNDEAYRHKAWVLRCFSQVRNQVETFPYQLLAGDKQYYFIAGEEEIVLEDSDVKKPPFHLRETIQLQPGAIPNVKTKVNTTYGQLLTNMVALVYPFGDKIEYVAGEFNIKSIETQIAERLTTDPEYQTEKTRVALNPIFVTEYLRFIDAALSMEGYAQLCVPSATAKTLTRDPRIPALRKKLLEEHKDRLNDPAVVAQIDAELVAMDKEWMKGDLGEGFYQKSKSYENARKKIHLMYGFERGFGQPSETIASSLSEGWEIDKLPAMVNNLREGSYGRGKLTELGGFAMKTISRMLQNTRVAETDCGSTVGWSHVVTTDYVGFYYIGRGGKATLVTPENFPELKGQTLTFRTPQFCKTKDVKFCRCCVGEPNGENESALAQQTAGLAAQLQGLMMKGMHDTSIRTTTWDADTAIT